MLKKKVSVFRKKHVPQTIRLLDEAGIFANNEDVYLKQILRDKGFIKEVHDTADKTLETYHYCDSEYNKKSYSGFNVTLGGSLDIINPSAGGCSSPKCRCNETINIARTAGLFANKLFISDWLSAYLSSYNKSGIRSEHIQMMTSVLSILAPLIDNKVIELRKPGGSYCNDCIKKIDSKTTLFLDSILDLETKFDIIYLRKENRNHRIAIVSPEFTKFIGTAAYITKISNAEYLNSSLKMNKEVISANIKDEPFFYSTIRNNFKIKLRNVIQGTESANETSSLFMAKSELDTLFLNSLNSVHIKNNEIEQWEAIRSINLPWVGQLDINQIIRLREEASLLLESLRNRITVGFMQGGKQKVTDVVAEITAKIPELKEEILAKEFVKKSQKKSTFDFGALAIPLVFYGLASANPIAAVGSVAALLASISHLHEGEKEAKKIEARIITSPAYALLKAKDLLSCQEKK